MEPLDADNSVHGIYVTLNEVNPALLSAGHWIKMRLGKKDSTTSDADILRRCWLPIDIDPLRPSGVRAQMRSTSSPSQKPMRWPVDRRARLPDPVRPTPATGPTCCTHRPAE